MSIAVVIIKQFADQVKIRLFSQLVNSISRFLQKLLRSFNGTIVSTSFVPSLPVWPVIFCLNLSEALFLSSGKSILLPAVFKAGSSL